jgi:hypothetical protein
VDYYVLLGVSFVCLKPRVPAPARAGRKRKVVDHSQPQALDAGPRDHSAIVGAKSRRRQDELEPRAGGEPLQAAANHIVGGDSASHHERVGKAHLRAKHFQRVARAVDDHIDDRRLKRGAQISHIIGFERTGALGRQAHGGFQA